MTYVENKRKELKTDYLEDTPDVGKQMSLIPRMTNVPRSDKVGLT